MTRSVEQHPSDFLPTALAAPHRRRILLRCLGFLRPYWRMAVGAYCRIGDQRRGGSSATVDTLDRRRWYRPKPDEPDRAGRAGSARIDPGEGADGLPGRALD